uniref:Uncharacterized protein n=1 Tax=Rhizophora mucronata TaxID=61149 RepID=A0A2P2JDW3_RHIMU
MLASMCIYLFGFLFRCFFNYALRF